MGYSWEPGALSHCVKNRKDGDRSGLLPPANPLNNPGMSPRHVSLARSDQKGVALRHLNDLNNDRFPQHFPLTTRSVE